MMEEGKEVGQQQRGGESTQRHEPHVGGSHDDDDVEGDDGDDANVAGEGGEGEGEEEESGPSFQLFSTRRPRDVGAGLSSGLKSIGKGVGLGLASLVAAPVAGAYNSGAKGFAAGLGMGVLGAVALPVTGALVGSAQIMRGVFNTPEAVMAKAKGQHFDPFTREWVDFRIDAAIVPDSPPVSSSSQRRRHQRQNRSGSRSAGGDRDDHGGGEGDADGDFYTLLGVSRDASEEEIRKNYYKRARQWHPDKNPGDEKAAERFQRLGQAYQVLSNPDLRTKYDQGGEENLSEDDTVDASFFFTVLFGSDLFAPYVGELALATAARLGDDVSEKTMYRAQLYRVAQLAQGLAARLDTLTPTPQDQDQDQNQQQQQQQQSRGESGASALASSTQSSPGRRTTVGSLSSWFRRNTGMGAGSTTGTAAQSTETTAARATASTTSSRAASSSATPNSGSDVRLREEAYRALVREEAEKLVQASFGVELLNAIGREYKLAADVGRGGFAGFRARIQRARHAFGVRVSAVRSAGQALMTAHSLQQRVEREEEGRRREEQLQRDLEQHGIDACMQEDEEGFTVIKPKPASASDAREQEHGMKERGREEALKGQDKNRQGREEQRQKREKKTDEEGGQVGGAPRWGRAGHHDTGDESGDDTGRAAAEATEDAEATAAETARRQQEQRARLERMLEEEALPTMLEAMWAGNLVDIETTLQAACHAALAGNTYGLDAVGKEQRRVRCRALQITAEEFMAVAAAHAPSSSSDDRATAGGGSGGRREREEGGAEAHVRTSSTKREGDKNATAGADQATAKASSSNTAASSASSPSASAQHQHHQQHQQHHHHQQGRGAGKDERARRARELMERAQIETAVKKAAQHFGDEVDVAELRRELQRQQDYERQQAEEEDDEDEGHGTTSSG